MHKSQRMIEDALNDVDDDVRAKVEGVLKAHDEARCKEVRAATDMVGAQTRRLQETLAAADPATRERLKREHHALLQTYYDQHKRNLRNIDVDRDMAIAGIQGKGVTEIVRLLSN